MATNFNVKHQGKDIHHPPSIFFSLVAPMPFPFPELHNYNFKDLDSRRDVFVTLTHFFSKQFSFGRHKVGIMLTLFSPATHDVKQDFYNLAKRSIYSLN